MPFKDPEAKKRWSKEWRKQSIENGYGKWLYQRRALRFSDAEYFREALEEIAKGKYYGYEIAGAALEASAERWSDLGPAPGGAVRTKPAPTQADEALSAAVDLSSNRS